MATPLDRTTYRSVDALFTKLESLTGARVNCLIDDTVQTGWGAAYGPSCQVDNHNTVPNGWDAGDGPRSDFGHNVIMIPGVSRLHRHVVAVTHVLDLIHAIESPTILAYIPDEKGLEKSRTQLLAAARPTLNAQAEAFVEGLLTNMSRMLRQGLRNVIIQHRIAREFPDLFRQHVAFCRAQVVANLQPLTIASQPSVHLPDWFRIPVRRIILAETLGLTQVTGDVPRWLSEALDSKATDARDARSAVDYLVDPEQAALSRKTTYNFTFDYSRYPTSLVDWEEARPGELAAGDHHWGEPDQRPPPASLAPPKQPIVQPVSPYHALRREAAAANDAGEWAKAHDLFTQLMDQGGSADPLALVGRATASFKVGDFDSTVRDARVALSLASHEDTGDSARTLLAAIYHAKLHKGAAASRDVVRHMLWAMELFENVDHQQGRATTLEAILIENNVIDSDIAGSYTLRSLPGIAIDGLRVLVLSYVGIRACCMSEVSDCRCGFVNFEPEWKIVTEQLG